MMNEIANAFRQNQQWDKALLFYKKALLCMKRRHKNKYLSNYETS